MKKKAITPIIKIANIVITILFVLGTQVSAVGALADEMIDDKKKELVFKDDQKKASTTLWQNEEYTFDLTTKLEPGKNKLTFSAGEFVLTELKKAPLPDDVVLIGSQDSGYVLNLNGGKDQEVKLTFRVKPVELMKATKLKLEVGQESFSFGKIVIAKKQNNSSQSNSAQEDVAQVDSTEQVFEGTDTDTTEATTDSKEEGTKDDKQVQTKSDAATTVKNDSATNEKDTSNTKQAASNIKENRQNSSWKATNKQSVTDKAKINSGTIKETRTQASTKSENSENSSNSDDPDGEQLAKLKNNLSPRADGRDVTGLIGENSFFSSIDLKIGAETIIVGPEGATLPKDVDPGTKFNITYNFNVQDINKKLTQNGEKPLQVGDSYSYEIKGLNIDLGPSGQSQGILWGKGVDDNDEEYGSYILENKGNNQVKVTLQLTNKVPIENRGHYTFSIEGTYPEIKEVILEHTDEISVTVGVDENSSRIAKSGKFDGADGIDWTINVWGSMNLNELTLKDTLDQYQKFNDENKWEVIYYEVGQIEGKKLKNDQFTVNNGTISFDEGLNIRVEQVTLKIKTQITNLTVSEFSNTIAGTGNSEGIGSTTAKISRNSNEYKTTKFVQEQKSENKWVWTARFHTFGLSNDQLKKLEFTDTMQSGTKNPTNIKIYASDKYGNKENDVTELFILSDSKETEFSGKVNEAILDDNNLDKLTNKFITITYESEILKNADEDSYINKVTNEFKWFINISDDNTSGNGTVSHEVGKINKTTSNHDLEKQTVDWKISANPGKWEWKDTSTGPENVSWYNPEWNWDTKGYVVVDTLPKGMDFAKKDDENYDLSKIIIETGNLDEARTLEELTNGNNPVIKNYKIYTGTDERVRLVINFLASYSGEQINIHILDTKYDYNAFDNNLIATTYELKNIVDYYVGSYTGSGYATAHLPKKIYNNAYKDVDLITSDETVNDQKKLKADVEWTIGFNTRELHDFKVDDEVTITDTLNNGIPYLSFDDLNESDFKLYEVNRGKSNVELGKQLMNDDYVLGIEKTSGDQAKITIRFKKEFTGQAFALKFKTSVDFEAWNTATDPEQKDLQKYENRAVINFGEFRDIKVNASVGMNVKKYYMQKQGSELGGNQVRWSGYINGSGKDLSKHKNITIIDKPSPGHRVDINSIKLWESQITGYQFGDMDNQVTPIYQDADVPLKSSFDDHSNYQYLITANEDGGFTITFAAGYKLDGPLKFEYNSIVDKPGQKVRNNLSLNADGYSVQTDAEFTVSSSGYFESYGVQVNKVDENDKPLAGAEFTLQQKNSDGKWETATNLAGTKMISTTSGTGQIQFNLLSKDTDYRVVETKTPAGYHGNYTSETFNYDTKESLLVKIPVVNTTTPPGGALKISKSVVGENPLGKEFEFVITAVNKEGKIVDSINGAYTLQTKNSNGTINFTNGVSEPIKMQAGDQVVLPDLKVFASQDNKEQISYTIEETNNQGYNSEFWLDDSQTGVTGNQITGVEIPKENNKDTHVRVINAKESGDLFVQKTVTGTPSNPDQKFEFDVLTKDEATGKNDQVRDKTFKAEIVDQNGETVEGSIEEVTFSEDKDEDGYYHLNQTVKLQADQKLVIEGLPKGLVVQIFEKGGNYETSSNYKVESKNSGYLSSSVTVDSTANKLVNFTNHFPSGSFKLAKQVIGANTDQEFEFTLGSNKLKGKYTGKILDVNDDSKETTIDFGESGLATISLKDNESFVLSQLPIDAKIKVTENDYSKYQTSNQLNSHTVKAGLESETATISDDETQEVIFYNKEHTSEFTVTKRVATESSAAIIDENAKYQFDLYLLKDETSGLTDANLTDYLISGKQIYEYELLEDGHKVSDGTLTFIKGHATTTLKKDQSIRIIKLNVGQKVLAKEQITENYRTTYRLTGGSESETAPVVVLDKDQHLTVTNTCLAQPKVHTLTIDKTVTGSTSKREFTFKLKLYQNHTESYVKPISGSLNNQEFTNWLANASGEYVFTLAHHDTITFTLPVGVSYQVVEAAVKGFETDTKGTNGNLAGTKVTGSLASDNSTNQIIHYYNRAEMEVPMDDETNVPPADTNVDIETPLTNDTITSGTGTPGDTDNKTANDTGAPTDTNAKGGDGTLPQTDSAEYNWLLALIGTLLLTIAGYFVYKFKHQNL